MPYPPPEKRDPHARPHGQCEAKIDELDKRISDLEQALSDVWGDVDALYQQINTLGRRLAEAQQRHKKARRREHQLREAISDALFAFDQGRTQDAAGTLREAVDDRGDADA